MIIYNKDHPEFDIPYGNNAIIGFQQVLSNPDKVFIWMKGTIKRPNKIDRHKTSKLVNASFLKVEYSKSVWLIESAFQHLGRQLREIGITEEHLYNLQYDELSDKWRTVNDGDRNFIKAVILNPISEVTGEYLNIQITQHTETPDSVYQRARDESNGNIHLYKKLLTKYRNKCIVRKYTKELVTTMSVPEMRKRLVEVYKLENGIKKPVYETREIVIGEPSHIFIDYTVPSNKPVESIDDIKRDIEEYKHFIDNLPVQQTLDLEEKYKHKIIKK